MPAGFYNVFFKVQQVLLKASFVNSHVGEEEEETARFHRFGFHRGAIFVHEIITLNYCKHRWQTCHTN